MIKSKIKNCQTNNKFDLITHNNDHLCNYNKIYY